MIPDTLAVILTLYKLQILRLSYFPGTSHNDEEQWQDKYDTMGGETENLWRWFHFISDRPPDKTW